MEKLIWHTEKRKVNDLIKRDYINYKLGNSVMAKFQE
jgi:hypothetical protein